VWGTSARGAASHGELNLSDRGGGNLPEAHGHSSTRLVGGGSTAVGRRGGRGRRWTGRRGCWVLRSHRGFSWLTGGGIKVGTRGGSVMASTAAQCGKRAEEEEGTPRGGGGCSHL
jgi:hypothetical protein